MTAWLNGSASIPISLLDIGDTLSTVADGAAADAASLSARLGSLTGTAFTPGELAGSAGPAVAARSQLDQLAGSMVSCCCVHPFQFGVKEQGSRGHYLSFPNALARLAGKLVDGRDPHLPETHVDASVLVVAISDATVQGFTTKLQAFNQWFPVPALQMAARRAANQLQQQQIRYHITPAAESPAFESLSISRMPAMRSITDVLQRRVAMAESYNAENVDPIADLATVISEKQAHAASMADAYNNLSLSGSPFQVLHVSGSSTATLQQGLLSAVDGKGFDHAYTAMLMFVGSPGSLQLLTEFFVGGV